MGVFPACISSCLWLLSRNDFQKHQHSAQAYKEAQPPVGFATHAPAWLLLNIRHKPFIYTYCFLLLKIRPISTVINSDIPISVGMAGIGPYGCSKCVCSLFLVPCICHTFKVCSFVLTGQTACEVSPLCAWINTALRIRPPVGILIANALKMLSKTALQCFLWGHSLWKLLPANLFTGTLTGRKHRKGENIIESNSFQNGMNEWTNIAVKYLQQPPRCLS